MRATLLLNLDKAEREMIRICFKLPKYTHTIQVRPQIQYPINILDVRFSCTPEVGTCSTTRTIIN